MIGRLQALPATDRQALVALTLLVLAMILGGGGAPSPRPELWLQLLTGLLAIAWLWCGGTGARAIGPSRLLVAVGALALLLPALQLVPLPPSVWTSLPGRETEYAALALVGEQDSWRPLTLSTSRTLASLLALVPPVLLLLMTSSLAHRQRRWLVSAIAVVALVSALVGAIQLAGGAAAPRLYQFSHEGVITGFHANRNAAADVLLIGIVALGLVGKGTAIAGRKLPFGTVGLWRGGVTALLALAVILTASRMGILLLALALLSQWSLLRMRAGGGPTRPVLPILAGVVASAAVALFFLRENTALRGVAQRFDVSGDARTELWSDSLFAIGQYWPIGAGFGTFVPAFVAAERLEAVDATMPNRAHNDYLELALEAGLPGLIVLGAILLMLGCAAWRGWRAGPEQRLLTVCGLAMLGIIAAHSVVDYPLRSMALASLAAVAAGLLSPPRNSNGNGDGVAADRDRGNE